MQAVVTRLVLSLAVKVGRTMNDLTPLMSLFHIPCYSSVNDNAVHDFVVNPCCLGSNSNTGAWCCTLYYFLLQAVSFLS